MSENDVNTTPAADDTEGHAARYMAIGEPESTTNDDTEGHRIKLGAVGEAGEAPVEGGRRTLPAVGDEDDTEGHAARYC